MQFVQQNGRTVLKDGRKVRGYISIDRRGGYAYNIGKPSDAEVANFTGEEPLSFEMAKERLYSACNTN